MIKCDDVDFGVKYFCDHQRHKSVGGYNVKKTRRLRRRRRRRRYERDGREKRSRALWDRIFDILNTSISYLDKEL